MKNKSLKNRELYIGIMSGTSLDGVDCVLVEFSNPSIVKTIDTHFIPYNKIIKNQINEAIKNYKNNSSLISKLDLDLGKLYARAVIELLAKAKISSEQISAIGCHGQTIAHLPNIDNPYSLQIGSANIIQETSQITTISDFRNNDINHGGQGAPLAPIFHQWYFSKFAPCSVVNIGGIANISVINQDNSIKGWDTGPGNTLLDSYFRRNQTGDYDKNGDWGKSGKINNQLLSSMLNDPYFSKAPPKSTGTDYFNLEWLLQFNSLNINPVDIQATLTALSAKSIANDISNNIDNGPVYICGGGVHNNFLLNLIQEFLGNKYAVRSSDAVGIAPDWLEAICFAWLAKQRINKSYLDLSQITGSSEPLMLGARV
jgi:anhydro-N-acetylmuramic acid kinase